MIEKLNEEYLENQTKLNLSEVYTNEEIKLLKKIIPDINNIIYLVSGNDYNSSNNNKINYQPGQLKHRYYSSLRKIKNNLNVSLFINKEKFYSLILNFIKQFFEKEHNTLLAKSVALLMDEILNLSQIIKQNLIYSNFFKSIKNPRLIEVKKSAKSQSRNREKPIKNSNTKDSKKIINLDLNLINTNEKLKKNKNKNKNLNLHNNTTYVAKQLSFKMETEGKLNNKSSFEIHAPKNLKNAKGNSPIKNSSNSISKRNPSAVHIKNKNKGNISNLRKGNTNLSLHKNNLSSTTYNCSYNPKNINNNFRLGQTKISLKKVVNANKNIALYEIVNNTKSEFNLSNTYQNKKFFKNKENKSLNKDVKNCTNKYCSPSSFDSSLYSDIETQEFNIFKLEKKIGRENILLLIGYYIFNAFNLNEVIKPDKFEKWCKKISDGYIRNNYYHNDLHAADITQTCLLYFKLGEIETMQKFKKSSLCSLFFSCICHDYQHPGVNNNFLKETKNKLSIRYNDVSILENMHISTTFKLILNDKECNIFEGVDNNLYKEMRKEMISCVLATDMASHNVYLDFLKNYIKEAKEGEKKETPDINQKIMNVLIHSADISNPTKLFDIYFEWAKLVVEEFWDQGDKEKELNLPCFCDREKVSIYQSQLGFINFIEIPYFSLFAEFYPKLKFFYENLVNNKNILLSMQEKEKEKGKEKEKEKDNKK